MGAKGGPGLAAEAANRSSSPGERFSIRKNTIVLFCGIVSV
jgi:hypothetical protein